MGGWRAVPVPYAPGLLRLNPENRYVKSALGEMTRRANLCKINFRSSGRELGEAHLLGLKKGNRITDGKGGASLVSALRKKSMNLWRSIKNWLFSSSPFPARLDQAEPERLDVEALAQELDIDAQAERLGKAGIPAPDETELTGVERNIVRRAEQAQQDYVTWSLRRLSILNQQLIECDTTKTVNRVRQADKEFERAASVLLAGNETHLADLARRADQLRTDLQEFRKANGLNRAPEYPGNSRRLLQYVVLVALVLLEGIINTNFFSQGLMGGLADGFFYAVMAASANIGVAASFGRKAVPNLFHKSRLRKVTGVLGSLTGLILVVLISLNIAHLRDALVAQADEPLKVAWTAFWTAPWVLNDTMSGFLLFISLGFAIGAASDAFMLDDWYPGYGKAHRRATKATEESMEELEFVRQELEELKNTALNTLDKDVQRTETLLLQRAGVIQDKITVRTRLTLLLKDAENCLSALLNRFRNTNEMHSNGLPRPGYFRSPPILPAVTLPAFDIEHDERARREQREQVARLLAEMDGIRANIQAAYNVEYNRLVPLHMQFEGAKEAT